jgi:hypothetical protein
MMSRKKIKIVICKTPQFVKFFLQDSTIEVQALEIRITLIYFFTQARRFL